MKKIVLSALLLCSLSVQANEMSTFAEVSEGISQGKQITFVLNFKECTSEIPLSGAKFSLTPNAVAVVGDSRITASNRHFTLDDPMGRGTPMYNYSKINIDSEGEASIKLTTMKAENYEKMYSYVINCELGKGLKVFG